MKSRERAVWVSFIFLIAATVVYAGASFTSFLRLKRPNTNYDVFFENETDGVVNLSTSRDSIGDLRPTGIHFSIPIVAQQDTQTIPREKRGAFYTQWVALADSDNGIFQNQDIILDSVTFIADIAAGTPDSGIVRLYSTTTNATLVDGPDTLIWSAAGHKRIDLTNIAASSRDFDVSAGEYPALQIVEVGSLYTVTAILHGRTYDVQ